MALDFVNTIKKGTTEKPIYDNRIQGTVSDLTSYTLPSTGSQLASLDGVDYFTATKNFANGLKVGGTSGGYVQIKSSSPASIDILSTDASAPFQVYMGGTGYGKFILSNYSGKISIEKTAGTQSGSTGTAFLEFPNVGASGAPKTIAITDDIPDVSNFVTGPSSANGDAIIVFNGNTGKIIKDSGITITQNTGYGLIKLQNKDLRITAGPAYGSTLGIRLYNGTSGQELTPITKYDGSQYSSTKSFLGTSTLPWTDLYLSGNLSDGTNSITVAELVTKANDSDVIHKGTYENPISEERYGDLLLAGNVNFGGIDVGPGHVHSVSSTVRIYSNTPNPTIINADGITSVGGLGYVRASKYHTGYSGMLANNATYDKTKITYAVNDSGTMTSYDIAFPEKTGTIALTSDCGTQLYKHYLGYLEFDTGYYGYFYVITRSATPIISISELENQMKDYNYIQAVRCYGNGTNYMAGLYCDLGNMYITNAKNDNSLLSVSSITFGTDIITKL